MGNFIKTYDNFLTHVLNEGKQAKVTSKEPKKKNDRETYEPNDLVLHLPDGDLRVQTTLDYIELTCGGRNWQAVLDYLQKKHPKEQITDESVSQFISEIIRKTEVGEYYFSKEGEDSYVLWLWHLIIFSLLRFPEKQEDFKSYDKDVTLIINT